MEFHVHITFTHTYIYIQLCKYLVDCWCHNNWQLIIYIYSLRFLQYVVDFINKACLKLLGYSTSRDTIFFFLVIPQFMTCTLPRGLLGTLHLFTDTNLKKQVIELIYEHIYMISLTFKEQFMRRIELINHQCGLSKYFFQLRTCSSESDSFEFANVAMAYLCSIH